MNDATRSDECVECNDRKVKNAELEAENAFLRHKLTRIKQLISHNESRTTTQNSDDGYSDETVSSESSSISKSSQGEFDRVARSDASTATSEPGSDDTPESSLKLHPPFSSDVVIRAKIAKYNHGLLTAGKTLALDEISPQIIFKAQNQVEILDSLFLGQTLGNLTFVAEAPPGFGYYRSCCYCYLSGSQECEVQRSTFSLQKSMKEACKTCQESGQPCMRWWPLVGVVLLPLKKEIRESEDPKERRHWVLTGFQ